MCAWYGRTYGLVAPENYTQVELFLIKILSEHTDTHSGGRLICLLSDFQNTGRKYLHKL